jgi:hypothetical protein
MNIDDLYPSKFLKAGDLSGPMRVTIATVSRDAINGEQKVIMAFATGEKSLILNKTNARAVSKQYGEDTRGWIGKEIVLVPSAARRSRGRATVACWKFLVDG